MATKINNLENDQALKNGQKTPLDDSGDTSSRLYKIVKWVLAWHAVFIPLGVAFGREQTVDQVTTYVSFISGAQALAYLQWFLPIIFGIFGVIKASQKVGGAITVKK